MLDKNVSWWNTDKSIFNIDISSTIYKLIYDSINSKMRNILRENNASIFYTVMQILIYWDQFI